MTAPDKPLATRLRADVGYSTPFALAMKSDRCGT